MNVEQLQTEQATLEKLLETHRHLQLPIIDESRIRVLRKLNQKYVYTLEESLVTLTP